jgi:hypothetical protein
MKITQKTSMAGMLFLILVIIALIIAGPLLVIWSLNTLFPALAIPYTIWTWLAALILGSAVAPKITKRD